VSKHVIDLLGRARAFIERGWVQGTFAVNDADEPVDPTDPGAIAWCVYGAILAAREELGLTWVRAAWIAVATTVECRGALGDWNDSLIRTKPDVLRAIDWTQERLRKEAR
jgi:hypothetical protein